MVRDGKYASEWHSMEFELLTSKSIQRNSILAWECRGVIEFVGSCGRQHGAWFGGWLMGGGCLGSRTGVRIQNELTMMTTVMTMLIASLISGR